MDSDRTYNQRLFEDNKIRSFLHNGRFNWFQKKCKAYQTSNIRMIELGCFDGRLIQFCSTEPIHYKGFDAGWEGGLELAKKKYITHPDWSFEKALVPNDIAHLEHNTFNLGAAMETLEHIPPELVEDYLKELSRLIDGYFFVTVPNEKGIVFLIKYLVKVLKGSNQKYSWREFFNAAVGRLHKIEQDDHKGFDYDVLINQVSKYFDVVLVEPIPFLLLPRQFGFTIGIVAKSKRK